MIPENSVTTMQQAGWQIASFAKSDQAQAQSRLERHFEAEIEQATSFGAVNIMATLAVAAIASLTIPPLGVIGFYPGVQSFLGWKTAVNLTKHLTCVTRNNEAIFYLQQLQGACQKQLKDLTKAPKKSLPTLTQSIIKQWEALNPLIKSLKFVLPKTDLGYLKGTQLSVLKLLKQLPSEPSKKSIRACFDSVHKVKPALFASLIEKRKIVLAHAETELDEWERYSRNNLQLGVTQAPDRRC